MVSINENTSFGNWARTASWRNIETKKMHIIVLSHHACMYGVCTYILMFMFGELLLFIFIYKSFSRRKFRIVIFFSYEYNAFHFSRFSRPKLIFFPTIEKEFYDANEKKIHIIEHSRTKKKDYYNLVSIFFWWDKSNLTVSKFSRTFRKNQSWPDFLYLGTSKVRGGPSWNFHL